MILQFRELNLYCVSQTVSKIASYFSYLQLFIIICTLTAETSVKTGNVKQDTAQL